MSERRGRIHEKHELSKTRRCELLDVARSSAYYRGEPVSEADLAVMRLIDETHLQWPFYGSRRMRDELEERGHTVNRKRVQRLMRQMGLRALYPRRRTSQPGKGHKIYPYLLRDLSIERANQAWASGDWSSCFTNYKAGQALEGAGRIFVLTEAPGFQGGSSLGWTSCLSCGTSLLHRGCTGAGTGWSFRR